VRPAIAQLLDFGLVPVSRVSASEILIRERDEAVHHLIRNLLACFALTGTVSMDTPLNNSHNVSA
jgi:hypothetical protein